MANIISDFFKFRQASKTKSFDDSGWGNIVDSNKYGNVDLINQFDQVFSDIDVIINTCASIKPLFVRKSDEDKEVSDHWIMRLFNQPNSSVSPHKFMLNLYGYYLTFPNAYMIFEFAKGSRLPVGIKLPIPSTIQKQIINNEITYRDSDGVIQNDRVLDIFGFNPITNINGYTPIQSINRLLSIEDVMLHFQESYYRNASLPGALVFVKGDESVANKVSEMLKNIFKGAKNSNKIGVIPLGSGTVPDEPIKFYVPELQKQTTTPELYDAIQKLKAKPFRVPDEIKGDVKSSNLASAKVAQDIFIRNTIKPLVEFVYGEINHYLNVQFPKEDIKITFSLGDFLPNNYEEVLQQATIAKTLVEAGYDPAGALEVANLPSIDYVGVYLPQDSINTQKMLNNALESLNNDEKDTQKTLNNHRHNEKQLSIDGNRGIAIHVKRVEKDTNKFLSQQLKRLKASLGINSSEKAIKKALSTGDIDAEFDINAETELMMTELLPTFLAVSESAVKFTNSNSASSVESVISEPYKPYKLDDQSIELLRDRLLNSFNSFNTTTKNELITLVNNALNDNETVGQISRKIEGYYSDEYKAQRLSRTEVNRSYRDIDLENSSRISEQYDLTYTKTWRVTSGDPCEFCLSLDGQELESGESFVPNGEKVQGVNGNEYVNNWDDVEAGGLHPNCTCTIVKTWRKN